MSHYYSRPYCSSLRENNAQHIFLLGWELLRHGRICIFKNNCSICVQAQTNCIFAPTPHSSVTDPLKSHIPADMFCREAACAESINRTKWFFNQCNLRPCSAVREQFVKTISQVLNNNDSSLERMPVPQEPCDQWGMERQRRQKVGHVQSHIHPSVQDHANCLSRKC